MSNLQKFNSSSDSINPNGIMDARVEPEHDGGGRGQSSPIYPRALGVHYTLLSFLEDLADNGRVVGVVKRFCCPALVWFSLALRRCWAPIGGGAGEGPKDRRRHQKKPGGAGEGPKDRRRHQKKPGGAGVGP